MKSAFKLITALTAGIASYTASATEMEVAFPHHSATEDSVFVSDGPMKNNILTFEWKNGHAVYEGDILLRVPSFNEVQQFGAVTSVAGRRWPNAQVSYIIDGADRGTIEAAIQHWEDNTSFRFTERNDTFTGDHIAFVNGSGCASFVGRLGGRQEVTIGGGCSVGNTIHEIGHAVGFWHEHTRTDRNQFIRIVEENITDGREHNFEQNTNTTDVGAYDFGSIMHYSLTAFTSNGRNTIEPIVDVPSGIRIGQRTGLSPTDIETAQTLAGQTTTGSSGGKIFEYNDPQKGNYPASCSFRNIYGNGMGNTIYLEYRIICGDHNVKVSVENTNNQCKFKAYPASSYSVNGSCSNWRVHAN